jgi:hypothetical protein
VSELNIYEDNALTITVSRVLFENKNYYVKLPAVAASAIETEIVRARLTNFISWHPHNRVAVLRVMNRIGVFRFFDKEFDVRSDKLQDGIDGNRQFEVLLDDLVRLSREIVFDYSALTGSYREANKNALNASLLERFNYYRQLVLEFALSSNLESLIEQIVSNPHSRQVSEHVSDFVWNARQPTQKTIESLFKTTKHLAELSTDHPLRETKVKGLVSPCGMRAFFPIRALTKHSFLSYDTTENRFIKHVLLDIQNVCLAVKAQGNVTSEVIKSCDKMLSKVRTLLRGDFFSNIGDIGFLPTSSPTLTTRRGYREVFSHYLNSRLGARHLFDDFIKQSMLIDLKSIDLLYEYWVFYKVAKSLLGDSALVLSHGTTTKNGEIRKSIELSHNNISVAYNKTFSRKPGGSYSLSLRPDIIVQIDRLHENPYIAVIDAKYRNREIKVFEQELIGVPQAVISAVKSADIHKMHCYADAIEGVHCAVACYPGTEFVFFPRDTNTKIYRQTSDIKSLTGVGAIPLLPKSDHDHIEFDQVMLQLKVIATNEYIVTTEGD